MGGQRGRDGLCRIDRDGTAFDGQVSGLVCLFHLNSDVFPPFYHHQFNQYLALTSASVLSALCASYHFINKYLLKRPSAAVGDNLQHQIMTAPETRVSRTIILREVYLSGQVLGNLKSSSDVVKYGGFGAQERILYSRDRRKEIHHMS